MNALKKVMELFAILDTVTYIASLIIRGGSL